MEDPENCMPTLKTVRGKEETSCEVLQSGKLQKSNPDG